MNETELSVKPLSMTDNAAENPDITLRMPEEQAKQLLIEFVASGGLIVNEAGEVDKMSMEKFAVLIGWSDRTLYRWIDKDPDFNAKVFAAITRVHGAKRVARVLRGVFTQASMGKQKEAELYLRHFWPDYKDPKVTQEHEVGEGLVSLINAARERNIVEGEIITDPTGSGQDPNLLPDRP